MLIRHSKYILSKIHSTACFFGRRFCSLDYAA